MYVRFITREVEEHSVLGVTWQQLFVILLKVDKSFDSYIVWDHDLGFKFSGLNSAKLSAYVLRVQFVYVRIEVDGLHQNIKIRSSIKTSFGIIFSDWHVMFSSLSSRILFWNLLKMWLKSLFCSCISILKFTRQSCL